MNKMKLSVAVLGAVLLSAASLTTANAQRGSVIFHNQSVPAQNDVLVVSQTPEYDAILSQECDDCADGVAYDESVVFTPLGGRLLGRLGLFRPFGLGGWFFPEAYDDSVYWDYGCPCGCGGYCNGNCGCGCCCCAPVTKNPNEDDPNEDDSNESDDKIDFHTLFGNDPAVTKGAY